MLHDRDVTFTAASDEVFRTARAEVTAGCLSPGRGTCARPWTSTPPITTEHRQHRAQNLRPPDSHDIIPIGLPIGKFSGPVMTHPNHAMRGHPPSADAHLVHQFDAR